MKGIRELHNIGYVHLDIKPDNIMVENSKQEIRFTNDIEDHDLFYSVESRDHLSRMNESLGDAQQPVN